MSNDSVIERTCGVCLSKMRLVSAGKNRKPQYRCQPCHTKNVREKYFASRDKASKKWAKEHPDVIAAYRKEAAIKECGVASWNSVRSKRSEKLAHNARQRWTIYGDNLVLSEQHTETELAKMLGRSIRAVQRRKSALRLTTNSTSVLPSENKEAA